VSHFIKQTAAPWGNGIQKLKSIYSRKDESMNLHISFGPVLSIIAGIIILIFPKLLNYIVAIYLIIMGILGLFGTGRISL
jgi:hypothetical protein